MNKTTTNTLVGTNDPSKLAVAAAWLAILTTIMAILLLAALHLLSPEFSPSWRVISEYAFGHYAWVLSLMFLSWGIGSWALVVAVWSQVHTRAGTIGLWLLIVAGIGEAMASYFDIRHEIGHGIAGLLGVIGFPIAALLISSALGRNVTWASVRRPLFWIANLSWVTVVLLVATLAIMTMQMARINGGHLPQHAPKSLPPGVLALDGWADRMIVLTNCAWVLLAAWHAIRVRHKGQTGTSTKPSDFLTPVQNPAEPAAGSPPALFRAEYRNSQRGPCRASRTPSPARSRSSIRSRSSRQRPSWAAFSASCPHSQGWTRSGLPSP